MKDKIPISSPWMSGGHSKLHSMFGGSCYSELGEHHAGPDRKYFSNYVKSRLSAISLHSADIVASGDGLH